NDAISKNLHTRDRQVRDVLELLPEFLNVSQFLCWLAREDLWKGYDMGRQLSVLRQLPVCFKHRFVSQRIKPRSNPQAVVVLNRRAASLKKLFFARFRQTFLDLS